MHAIVYLAAVHAGHTALLDGKRGQVLFGIALCILLLIGLHTLFGGRSSSNSN